MACTAAIAAIRHVRRPCPGQRQGRGRSAARIATLAPGLSIVLSSTMLQRRRRPRPILCMAILASGAVPRTCPSLLPVAPACGQAAAPARRTTMHSAHARVDVSTALSHSPINAERPAGTPVSLARAQLGSFMPAQRSCFRHAVSWHRGALSTWPAWGPPKHQPPPTTTAPPLPSDGEQRLAPAHVDRDGTRAVLNLAAVQRAYRASQLLNVRPCLSRSPSRIVRSSQFAVRPPKTHHTVCRHAPACTCKSYPTPLRWLDNGHIQCQIVCSTLLR
jgi:hypothetical protein